MGLRLLGVVDFPLGFGLALVDFDRTDFPDPLDFVGFGVAIPYTYYMKSKK